MRRTRRLWTGRSISHSGKAILLVIVAAAAFGPAIVLLTVGSSAKKLATPMDRVAVNLDRYGNTSSASAFIALSESWQIGRLLPRGKILFLAFGAGFTWGAALCTCI